MQKQKLTMIFMVSSDSRKAQSTRLSLTLEATALVWPMFDRRAHAGVA
jgi:hypothetical protein